MEIDSSAQNQFDEEDDIKFIEDKRYPSIVGSNFYYYNNISRNPEQLYSSIKIFKCKHNSEVNAVHQFSFNFNFTTIEDYVSPLSLYFFRDSISLKLIYKVIS